MVEATDTIFQYYLVKMDSISEYLTEKYLDSNSIEDTKHYQTVIIQKIVGMFHTIVMLTKETQDEVSARCILRAILDSVTTYCFIYQRTDEEDMLFRHYLYALDGWKNYEDCAIGISEENDDKQKRLNLCNNIIKKLEDKLKHHSYYLQDSSKVEKLIIKRNWKYKSFHNISELSYAKMYNEVKFDASLSNYYQGYLSQFAHGLCLSNKPCPTQDYRKIVLYESIPIADRFVSAITYIFHDEKMKEHFLCSTKCKEFLNSKNFNYDDLNGLVKAYLHNDKTILI